MSVDVTALAVKVESTGIREASQALGGLSTSAANSEKRITAFTSAMEKLNSVSITSTSSMNAFMQKLQQQAVIMQGLHTSASGAASSTATLAAAINLLTAALTAVQVQSNQAARAQRNHNDGMREAHALARGLAGSLGTLWVTYGNLAGMAVGLAIGASLKGIVTVGKDVEQTLEGIRVKGQETTDSVDKIRTAVMDLGKGIYGPQEVAKAFETMILAGLTAKEALSGISDALNLATVGGTSIEKSAYTIVQVGTALGYASENYNRISDVIAKTAAVSMSSVESLSEAFKSGSVVGKLYGVTLVDIGTSLAALSNLGIQGSAAGTSLKNFYKELAANSDKVKNTLKDMKLVPDDFKDAQGNYKGVLEVVETLASGLGRLTDKQQKLAIANLSNERGMKTAIELLDLYKQKIGDATGAGNDHANMLSSLREKIEDSYGFAAIGAVQMSLTVESQFKSVANTLKTVLVGAFQQVSPELSVIATRLKAAFGSAEFASTINTLATAVANLTVFVVENAEAFFNVMRAILAFKAAGFVVGLLTGIAEAFITVKTAMDLAKISAIAFQASLGILGLALAAAAAAFVWYSTKKDEATNSVKAQAAITYSGDYATALEKEAERLTEQLRLLKEGKNARDAETESIMSQQRALAQSKGFEAKLEAENRLEKAWAGTSVAQVKISEDIVKRGGVMTASVRELKDAQANLARVNNEVDTSFKRIVAGQDAVRKSAIALEVERKAQADAANKPGTGTGVLAKEDKAGARDALAAELQKFQNQINEAKKQVEIDKALAKSEYKQGLIGEAGLIQKNFEVESKFAADKLVIINKEIAALEGKKNVKDKIAQLEGKAAIASATIDAAEAARANASAEYGVKLVQDTQKAQAEAFRKKGELVAAYLADEGRKHDIYGKQLESDFNNATDALDSFRILQLIVANDTAKTAGIQSAAVKEASNAFELLNAKMTNVFKGVQTASESGGLAAMWIAATEASTKYKSELEELTAAQVKLQAAADLSGSPEDQAKAQEALTKMKAQADHFKTMWSGVGQAISSSLEKAFGKGGKALGDMAKIAIDYSKQEQHSGIQQVKTYGDMAQAAQGFFKEGSTGYKVMGAVSTAFHVAELAMNLASIGPALAAGAAQMFAQSGWGGFAGVAAMMALMAGLGFSGGSAPMSSAQRQTQAGTGSVLGDKDAKSDSIERSLSILEKNSGLGLVQGTHMISYLKEVADNISGLASLVVRATGITSGKVDGVTEGRSISNTGVLIGVGPIGLLLSKIPVLGNLLSKLFGSTTSVVDQGIKAAAITLENVQAVGFKVQTYADVNTTKKFLGITYSNNTSTQVKDAPSEVSEQFGLVIKNLASSISSAADLLGVGGDAFTAHLNQFVVDIGNISIKGLTGDQIEKQFQAIFSKLGDDMAKFGIDGLAEFQKVGEGYFETLSRVANDLMQVKDVFAVLQKPFTEVGVAAVSTSEGLIKAVGSIDALTSGTKYFVENFYTAAEKIAPIAKSVKDRMAELGQSGVTTAAQFKDLVNAQNLSTSEGQSMYAALIAIAPAFKQVADYTKDLAEGIVELTKEEQKAKDIADKQRELDIRLMEAQGNTQQAVSERRKDELEALKKLSPALADTQSAIYTTLDVMDYATKARGLEIEYLNAQGKTQEATARTRSDEIDALKKINPALALMKEAIYAATDALAYSKQSRSLEIELLNAQGNSTGALVLTRSDELEALKKINPELVNMKQAVYDASDALKEAKVQSDIYAQILDLTGNKAAAVVLARKAELEPLSDTAKLLKLRVYALEDEAEALDKLKKAATTSFDVLSKAIDAAKANAKATFDAQEAIIKTQKSDADAALDAAKKSLDAQKVSAEASYEASKKALDDQKTASEAAYEAFKTSTQATIDTAKAANQAISDLASSVKSALGSVEEAAGYSMSRATAQSAILQAFAVARSTGVLPTADSLKDAFSEVSKNDKSSYASLTDFTRDSRITANALEGLGSISELAKSNSDKQLEALDQTLAVAKSSFDAQVASNEAQAVALKTAYDTQVADFAAQEQAATDRHTATIEKLDLALAAAQTQLDADNKHYDDVLSNAREQLDAMNGTKLAVMSVEEALKAFTVSVGAAISASQAANATTTAGTAVSPSTTAESTGRATIDQVTALYRSIFKRAPDTDGLNFWLGTGQSSAFIANEFLHSPEYMGMHGSHADGLDKVPFDNYRANLHYGERVQTAKAARDSDMTAEEIRQLRAELQAQNLSLIQITREQMKLIRKWDGNGIPLFRDEDGTGVVIDVNVVSTV